MRTILEKISTTFVGAGFLICFVFVLVFVGDGVVVAVVWLLPSVL